MPRSRDAVIRDVFAVLPPHGNEIIFRLRGSDLRITGTFDAMLFARFLPRSHRDSGGNSQICRRMYGTILRGLRRADVPLDLDLHLPVN
jgi:hypothetical protein